ncbi:MAG: glycosyltransferase family 2 protein, partial [Armatimonadota bacterium]
MARVEDVVRTLERDESPVAALAATPRLGGEAEVPRVTIVIPAFNEEDGIRGQVRAIQEAMADGDWPFEVLVVDDGSEDGTVDSLRDVSGVTVIRHGANRGYGAALKTGIRRARGEYVAIIDGDGTYPAAEIPHLLYELDGCDMAVGARTGDEVKVPLFRKPAKWVLRKLAEFLA